MYAGPESKNHMHLECVPPSEARNDLVVPEWQPRHDHVHIDNAGGGRSSRPTAQDDPHGDLRVKLKQTILLVDDEDIVRDMTRMILEDLGYEVIAASGGEEAIAALGPTP